MKKPSVVRYAQGVKSRLLAAMPQIVQHKRIVEKNLFGLRRRDAMLSFTFLSVSGVPLESFNPVKL